jgi:hypothetical protein
VLAALVAVVCWVGVAQAESVGEVELDPRAGTDVASAGAEVAESPISEVDEVVVLVLGAAVSTVSFVNDPPPPTISTLDWDPAAPSQIREHGWDPGSPTGIRTIEWDPSTALRSTVRARSAGEPSRIRTVEWNPQAPSRIRVHGSY